MMAHRASVHLQAMEAEHLRSAESTKPFVRTMNKKETTPELEWEIVVMPKPGQKYSSGRVGMPLEELRKLMDEKNEQLKAKGQAVLIIEEPVGARLYTGPSSSTCGPNRHRHGALSL